MTKFVVSSIFLWFVVGSFALSSLVSVVSIQPASANESVQIVHAHGHDHVVYQDTHNPDNSEGHHHDRERHHITHDKLIELGYSGSAHPSKVIHIGEPEQTLRIRDLSNVAAKLGSGAIYDLPPLPTKRPRVHIENADKSLFLLVHSLTIRSIVLLT